MHKHKRSKKQFQSKNFPPFADRRYQDFANTIGLLVLIGWSTRDGLTQLLKRLAHNRTVLSLSPMKGPRCFLEQETLPSLLSTSLFQEQIEA